ncbi:hypothetical protein [Aeromicrobium sp. CTD01-1L150]|uniref:hypothetical protein n=1 Tax=Aeromicrobium sp. CTD01-1L150 TaxID=3341830 RepID=UPI0035BF47F0
MSEDAKPYEVDESDWVDQQTPAEAVDEDVEQVPVVDAGLEANADDVAEQQRVVPEAPPFRG